MLLHEMVRQVRTQKGTPIKRYRWGVGKEMAGFVYLHRNYIAHIPPEQHNKIEQAYELARKQVGGPFDFNVVKIGIKTNVVSFFNSPDFDTEDEPTAGEFINVNLDIETVKQGRSNYIWHHKWLWVKDDYSGFDVEESFKRSQRWLQIPDIDFSRIGKREFWNKTIKQLQD